MLNTSAMKATTVWVSGLGSVRRQGGQMKHLSANVSISYSQTMAFDLYSNHRTMGNIINFKNTS